MDKSKIKNFAINARRELIGSVSQRLAQLGITTDGISQELPASTPELKYYTKEQVASNNGLTGQQIAWRSSIVNELRTRGYDENQQTVLEDFIEEVAYTWFNRIIAIRFMEVNNYLPTRVRVLSSESGNSEPDIIDEALNLRDDFNGFTPEEEQLIEDAQLSLDPRKLDQAYEILFIKQCDALAEILPGLFEKTKDYLKLLFTPNYNHGVIQELITEIPESYFDVQNEGQVQIIGWLYQYYISEPHDDVVNMNGSTIKKDDIPAATQLFTPDWIVKYMVDNSLGKYFLERHPHSELKNQLKYLLPDKNLQTIQSSEDINHYKFIDNAMGSGHVLVYAFDLFMKMYEEEGYSKRNAVAEIFQHNLYGLEIDLRAYQLAYFALMMKGREYDRRFFRRGIEPHVYQFKDLHVPDEFYEKISDKQDRLILQNYLADFSNAQEYGSFIKLQDSIDIDKLRNIVKAVDVSDGLDIYGFKKAKKRILYTLDIAEVMTQKYQAVVTNPPYMNKFDPILKKYLNKHYKQYSKDLFSVFIYNNISWLAEGGYSGYMAPWAWMFIKNYEKLRLTILKGYKIDTLIQLAYSAYEEATVPIDTFVLKKSSDLVGTYIRLVDVKGNMEDQRQVVLQAISDEDTNYLYHANQSNFSKIPGSPIAYWASEQLIKDFFENKKVKDYTFSDGQIKTGNNDLYLRKIWEVNPKYIGKHKKWALHAKGGEYRRWYGNVDTVINISPKAINHYKSDHVARFPKDNVLFRKGITWSLISSGSGFAMRYLSDMTTFNLAAPSILFHDEKYLIYILGFLNSVVARSILKILNPTINTNINNIINLPLRIENIDNVEKLVFQNISLSKSDWDAFETSWDFQRSPLLSHVTEHNHNWLLSEAFTTWQTETQDRFNQLKSNEEELNRIFINLYGLQDELTPKEEDKDVSIRLADRERDIKDFLSYFIGCIFGRYSLDTDGLAYAGGNWDADKYVSFKPNENNLLMLTDTQYFDDERDVIVRLREFLTKTFGADTVNDNLNFIAESLDANKYAKGTDSETIIRNYFINDFFKDHDKKYSKRPIYWEFNSGHSKGFKALMYLHRYDTGELAMVRQNMHNLQAGMNSRLSVTQKLLDAETVSKNKTIDRRIIANLKKQIDEIVKYDQILGSLSANPVDLDLDDGVLVNHAKLQNGYKLLSKL
ncbi:BREX-1 system adenine-specific DNA-methyltransferase PglX [Limosilactobacillus mucosae]